MRKTSEILWQDAQHQMLFDILDQIKQPQSDGLLLLRLRDYCEYHFALEELYMARLRYPGMDEHVQAHNHFRNEIFSLNDCVEVLDDSYRDIISTFLTDWLTRHIFGTDKQLEIFILESNSK